MHCYEIEINSVIVCLKLHYKIMIIVSTSKNQKSLFVFVISVIQF